MGWPFVGRAAELAEVRRAVRGAGLVVAGPAGVGKTRLLEVAGVPLVRATTVTAAIPLGVLAPWLPPDIPEGPLAMLHAARESLRGKVIGVDDAHLLDDASAVLLHQLVQHREAVVVATIRSGLQAPAPVTALWKDQLLDRLDLTPLGFQDFTSVLTEVLDGPVDSRAAEHLWESTAGNMLLLRELLLAEPMVHRDGLWRLDGPLPLSPRLTELIKRLARAAWAVGGGPPAAHLLAQVLAFTDRPEEAEEVFAMVASADEPLEIVAMRAMNIGWGLGRSAEAAAMVDTPLVRANLLFDAGKYAEALASLPGAEPAEAVIEAMINAVQGREPCAFPELRTWESVPLGSEMFTSAKVFIRSMYGDVQGAEEIAVEAHRARSEWDSMRSHWAIVRAGLARARGRLDDAAVLLREAQPARPFVRLCERAHVEALHGNDARDLLAAAEALVPQGQRPFRCGWLSGSRRPG